MGNKSDMQKRIAKVKALRHERGIPETKPMKWKDIRDVIGSRLPRAFGAPIARARG